MFDTSPITSWEGAAAYFNNAGGAGVHLWFWIAVALCVGTIIWSIRMENRIERIAKDKKQDP